MLADTQKKKRKEEEKEEEEVGWWKRRRGGGGRKTGRGRGKIGIQSHLLKWRGVPSFTKIHRIHLPLPTETQKPISHFTNMWN